MLWERTVFKTIILVVKFLSLIIIMTLFKKVLVPANLVPAAAVKREGQALSEMTGRKESVDCTISSLLNPKIKF